jgi:predicted ATPase
VKSELATAYEIAEEFLRLAERNPYAGLSMEITLMNMGEFTLAMEHFQRAFSLYDPQRDRDDTFSYAQNSGVATQCYASWTLWFLGQPDQALAQIESALALARELSEPHGLTHTLLFSAILHQLRREERIAQEHAEASIAIASEHGLLLYQATATVVRGWSLIGQGQPEEAIEQIQQGLSGHKGTGTKLLRPHFLALLAEALSRANQAEAGLLVLEEALAAADHTGERYYQAELYRLKGELLRQQSTRRALSRATTGGRFVVDDDPLVFAKVEACFVHSIKIAQRQEAKSLELRAVMSIARFYQSQGKRDEARLLLAQIYGKFTEGFETIDLREAKALLGELS